MNICICLCALTLCMGSFFGKNHLDELNQIERETAKSLESTYKMHACGGGGGAMFGIDMVMLAFQIERPITIEEARVILVGCEELYIKNINNNKAIRPYLEEYPFGPNRVELVFYVQVPKDKRDRKYIDIFSISCGGNIKVPTVEYLINIENGGLEDVFTETYEQAKERVHGLNK